MQPYKFTNAASKEPHNDKYHQLLISINSREDLESLSPEKLRLLHDLLQIWTHSNGIYKSLGWAYDLRPYLKRYWFEVNDNSDYSQFPSIHEAFAIDEKDLRKRFFNIIEVNEVPNNKRFYK